MLNGQNIYYQQIYGQNLIPQNYISNGPIAYGQFKQELPNCQKQVVFTGVGYNQQIKPIQPINMPHQIKQIPQFQQNIYQQNKQINFYQQAPQQNIYQQIPQQKIYQQNQYQNIYQQNSYHQIPQIIQRESNIQPKINLQSPITNTNSLIMNNQVKSIYNSNIFPSIDSYESAICRIKFNNLIGTGFFCEIDDNNIPFKKALFTNNHVLNKQNIQINNIISFEICKKLYNILITENRKVFTNEELDYTCIEY